MRVECFDSRSIPHISRLYSDFLYQFDKVSSFYPSPPYNRDWPLLSRSLDYPDDRRRKIAEILDRQNRAWGASEKTLTNIERLKNGAAAVVTGQQVVLFGGPLFALLKAATAVRLAQEATASGAQAVPIFWLATEDHDLDEVSTVSLLTRTGELERLTLPGYSTGGSVGSVKLGDGIPELVQQASSILGETEVADWLNECYRPEATFGDAFARLLCKVFATAGVVLVDASDPALHDLATPIYESAIENAPHLTRSLLERGKELEQRGYHAQVKVTNSSTLLFQIREGVRTPVQQTNGGFSLARQKTSKQHLLQTIRSSPADFSGNALLRPVIQDYLLPTLAYVGGPAEIAYFAQAAVVYQQILGRVTPIVPRISATVIDPAIARRLAHYALTLKDILAPPDQLHRLIGKRGLPPDVAEGFSKARALLQSALEELGKPLPRLDPTLSQAAVKASAKMNYQLSRLEARAARAQERRNGEISRHATQLTNTLFPHKNMQEREVAGVYFLSRYGPSFLSQILDSLSASCPDHQVLFL